MNLFELLILLWSFIKLQPQKRGRKDCDSALAGEENAFVFTMGSASHLHSELKVLRLVTKVSS